VLLQIGAFDIKSSTNYLASDSVNQADMAHLCFVPNARHRQRSEERRYSIASSAVASSADRRIVGRTGRVKLGDLGLK
jgi:hypothetical protein